MKIKANKIFLILERARQGLTSLLRISIGWRIRVT